MHGIMNHWKLIAIAVLATLFPVFTFGAACEASCALAAETSRPCAGQTAFMHSSMTCMHHAPTSQSSSSANLTISSQGEHSNTCHWDHVAREFDKRISFAQIDALLKPAPRFNQFSIFLATAPVRFVLPPLILPPHSSVLRI